MRGPWRVCDVDRVAGPVTDLPSGLSTHARGLAERFLASGRVRFGRAELWTAVAAVSPASAGTGDRRRILADALAELRDAGVVTVSRTVEPGNPPLPTQVTLAARPRAAPPVGRAVIWHPELAGAAGRPDPRGVLQAVNRWLFDGGTRAGPAPLRERALEITGDEKAFDGGLGAVLTLGMLRAVRVVLPLHRERVGDGRTLLVVENADTYDSLRHILSAEPGAVGDVGWGAGAAFSSSVLSLTAAPPAAIRYFGDLDAAGLRIPAAASELAQQSGLPPVLPATGLYTLLLQHGVRGTGREIPADDAHDLAGWLDPDHRRRAENVLTAGARLAQEAVGRRVLGADDGWRAGLDAR